jgi:rhodanese-related sulfurtransferase
MANPFNVPELTPAEIAEHLARGDDFILLDVRERYELAAASLNSHADVATVPVSDIIRRGPAALPPAAQDTRAEIVLFCHHGIRSAQVGAWLLQNGWTNVSHMEGGIDAYARDVDPSVGFY